MSHNHHESPIDYGILFESVLRSHPAALSAAGDARRAAIRRALETAVVWRRRRRVAVRLSVAALVVVGLAMLLWRPNPQREAGDPPPQVAAGVASWIVRDDPDVLARCAAVPAPLPSEVFVDDEELLRLLRAAGRPTGLCRVGRAVILTEPVIDELTSD